MARYDDYEAFLGVALGYVEYRLWRKIWHIQLANGHNHHSQGHRPWETSRAIRFPRALPKATLNIAFGETQR
ncbi:MAG: hypothetical protein ACK41S_13425 [Planctomycetota bacterium]